jgi:hypothetical protein
MAVGSIDLAPSPLRHDSFAITPERITAAGIRYLSIATRKNEASEAFYEQASHWTKKTSYTRIAPVIAVLRSRLQGNARQLASARWPRSARTFIDELTHAVIAERSELATAANAKAPPDRLRAIPQHTRVGVLGLRIRRAEGARGRCE